MPKIRPGPPQGPIAFTAVAPATPGRALAVQNRLVRKCEPLASPERPGSGCAEPSHLIYRARGGQYARGVLFSAARCSSLPLCHGQGMVCCCRSNGFPRLEAEPCDVVAAKTIGPNGASRLARTLGRTQMPIGSPARKPLPRHEARDRAIPYCLAGGHVSLGLAQRSQRQSPHGRALLLTGE